MSTISAGTTTTTALVNTGDTTGNLVFQTNGTTTAMTIDTSQNVGIGTSSPTFRMVAANSGTDGGWIYSSVATSILGLGGYSSATDGAFSLRYDRSTGNITFNGGTRDTPTERMRLDTNGNLLVGLTSIGAQIRFSARGSSTSSGDYTTFFTNSAGTTTGFIRNDGAFNTGVASLSPYNLTTASAANLFVDSGGTLYRSTSSLKYKTDVQDATHGLADVLKLRPVTYKGKNDGDTVFGGLIAEEVHEAGLTEFVQYAKDGSPDALHYGNMVSVLVKSIQEQQAMITQLQAEVAALKGAK